VRFFFTEARLAVTSRRGAGSATCVSIVAPLPSDVVWAGLPPALWGPRSEFRVWRRTAAGCGGDTSHGRAASPGAHAK
jgi:hypothetical protein